MGKAHLAVALAGLGEGFDGAGASGGRARGSGAAGRRPPPTTPQIGQPAPDFRLKRLDGETVTLAGLRGKGVIVDLRATWCTPRRAEMRALDAMQANGGN